MKAKTIQLNKLFKYRTEIFGFSALMIIFHHLRNRGIPGSSAMPAILENIISFVLAKANMGVDIFVFLSAVGLFFSMNKNSVKDFYLHRFSRVFVPWFIIMVPFFVYDEFIFSHESVIGFFMDVITLRYWFDNPHAHTPWFVPFIIALYILFPLLFRLNEKTKHMSTLVLLLLSVGFIGISSAYPNDIFLRFYYCFSRLPIFLFGLFVANFIKKDREIKQKHLIVGVSFSFVAFIVFFFLKLPDGLNLLYGSVLSIGLIAFYVLIRENNLFMRFGKFFAVFGPVSLEMYLIHTVMLRVIDENPLPKWAFASLYIFMPIVSFFLSKLVSILSKRIQKLLLKHQVA